MIAEKPDHHDENVQGQAFLLRFKFKSDSPGLTSSSRMDVRAAETPRKMKRPVCALSAEQLPIYPESPRSR